MLIKKLTRSPEVWKPLLTINRERPYLCWFPQDPQWWPRSYASVGEVTLTCTILRFFEKQLSSENAD